MIIFSHKKRGLSVVIIIAFIAISALFLQRNSVFSFAANNELVTFDFSGSPGLTPSQKQEITEVARQAIDKVCERYKSECGDILKKKLLKPISLVVRVGQVGAGGATSFAFDRGEVFGFRMNVHGDWDSIIRDVIPHEVTHIVHALMYRRPLPRCFDEGCASLSETPVFIAQQIGRLHQEMCNRDLGRYGISSSHFNDLIRMMEYPSQGDRVMRLYQAESMALMLFMADYGNNLQKSGDSVGTYGIQRVVATMAHACRIDTIKKEGVAPPWLGESLKSQFGLTQEELRQKFNLWLCGGGAQKILQSPHAMLDILDPEDVRDNAEELRKLREEVERKQKEIDEFLRRAGSLGDAPPVRALPVY